MKEGFEPIRGGWWKFLGLLFGAIAILCGVSLFVVNAYDKPFYMQLIVLATLYGVIMIIMIFATPLRQWLPDFWQRNVIGWSIVFTLNAQYQVERNYDYNPTPEYYIDYQLEYRRVVIIFNLRSLKWGTIYYFQPDTNPYSDKPPKSFALRNSSHWQVPSIYSMIEAESLELSVEKMLILFARYFAQPTGRRVYTIKSLLSERENERLQLESLVADAIRKMITTRSRAPNTKEKTFRTNMTNRLLKILDNGSPYIGEFAETPPVTLPEKVSG